VKHFGDESMGVRGDIDEILYGTGRNEIMIGGEYEQSNT
jgi:hypothetical protein